MKRTLLTLFSLFLFVLALAQEGTVSGKVTDTQGTPLPGVNIVVKGTNQGTTTDFDGNFKLQIQFPATLVFSYLGYETKTVQVDQPQNNLNVVMGEAAESLEDIVITASRTQEKIKESPVTIEKVGVKQIKYAAAPTFYDDLVKLRGVQMNTNSLTFQAINTRGFATFANNRVLQIIDGVDNSSPALNFPLGNLVGINDLDVASVELLPGTSSALYGANAFNGLLYITSKSPFKFQGLSTSLKGGITSQDAAGKNPMFDVALRYAKALNEKFAFKINFSYLKAEDWWATDYRDFDRHPLNRAYKGSRANNPSYNGLNIYGDEIATNLDLTAYGLGVIRVSRTGYREVDLTDYKATSLKADYALHFKPKGDDSDLEFILASRVGNGNTVYQGTNRYALRNLLLHQHKLEMRNKNYFVRAYYTSEDAGDSYDIVFTGWNINRKWRGDTEWFTDYARVYTAARLGLPPFNTALPSSQAHLIARDFADNSNVDSFGNPKTPRFEPGSNEFQNAYESVISDPDFKTGSKFIDKTSLFHVEGNYDFKDIIKNGLIQIGGSFRQFKLNSEGTIFTDKDSPIFIRENGMYVQYIQKLADDHAKITASLRYDKQNQMKGNFSPRIALVLLPGDKKHSLRVAYQTGFRNPTTQDLYIGLNLGVATLVGAAPDNWDRYSEEGIDANLNTYTLTGRDAYTNSYSLESFLKFAQTMNPADLKPATILPIGPEKIESIEFGYRGEFGDHFNVDVVYYKNNYTNFITQKKVMTIPRSYGSVHDMTGLNAIMNGAYKVFGAYTNSEAPISSVGVDFNLGYHNNTFRANVIYSYAEMGFNRDKYPDLLVSFNTPKNTFKFIMSDTNLFKNLGYSLTYKWMDEYYWEATFASETVPAHSTVDAMLSYSIPKYNLMFKVGGSNIFGKDYMVAPGTGKVGSIYYIGLLYQK